MQADGTLRGGLCRYRSAAAEHDRRTQAAETLPARRTGGPLVHTTRARRLSLLRGPYLGAVASLTALIALCVAWELWLAPLRPGGSWMVLKALPLLAPLRGVLHARVRTYQWASLLVLFYFVEGVVRSYADSGTSALLAQAEILAALIFIGSAVWLIRAARTPPPPNQT